MKKIVAYFPNWATYDAAMNNFTVSMIPWDKVTIVNHAFFTVNSSFKLVPIDHYVDYEAEFEHSGDEHQTPKGHMGEYKYYKSQYPDKTIMISVGGWTRGENFHAMASTQQRRAIFVQSVIDFLKTHPFIDGIDIDWEYPGINRPKDTSDEFDKGCPGGPEDKQNYTALLKEIREGYIANNLSNKLLTIAASAGYDKLALQEPALFYKYLDFITVMTYDFHGEWENITNHHSPLHENPADPSPTSPTDIKHKYNTEAAMKIFTDVYHIPAAMLLVGAPFYAHGWKNVDSVAGANGLFSPANGALPGHPFYKMKQLEATQGYIKYRDPYSKVPYLYNLALKEMYSYEDEQSLSDRCDLVTGNGYAGVMIWDISNDDNKNGYPLSSIVYNKMMGTGNLPGASAVTVDNITNTGNYTVTVTIPAGDTATTMNLSENNSIVKTATITPSSLVQAFSYVVTNKSPGTYSYCCGLKNSYGTTLSNSLTVTVTGQPSNDQWLPNKAYKAGDMVRYNNKLYKCLQPHTSLIGWEPANIPALWQLQ